MKKIISTLLCSAMLFAATFAVMPTAAANETETENVGANTYGDFEYRTLLSKDILITKYKGTEKNPVVPGTINGHTVVGLAAFSFQKNKTIETVTLPDSITEIDSMSFNLCSSLKTIEIPAAITEISYRAFAECTSLETVTFKGNNIEKISNNAFYKSGLKSIVLPQSLKEIGYQAFQECESLKSITFPNNLEIIGEHAFNSCTSLKEIEFDERKSKLNTIYSGTFQKCRSLTEIRLPESLKEMSSLANYFSKCDNLEKVYLPYSITILNNAIKSENGKLTIYAYENSSAYKYAIDHNIPVVSRGEYNPYAGSIIGDVDGDDKVTSADSLNILRYSVGLDKFTAIQKELSNVNGDNTVDSADALAVLRYSVGFKSGNIGNPIN